VSDAEREALVERFREYLERADDVRSPPAPGVTTGPIDGDAAAHAVADTVQDDTGPRRVDLFDLLTELAGLRNEVRLESRQLKGALERFGDLFDALRADNAALTLQLEARGDAERRAARDAERTMLLELVELRDRLAAGADAASAHRPGVLGRLGRRSGRMVESLAEGLGIALRRIDESLARRDVHRIPSLGEPMDPHTMRAVAIEHRPDAADGTVVGEARPGYRRGDDVLRTVDAIVNRHQEPTPT